MLDAFEANPIDSSVLSLYSSAWLAVLLSLVLSRTTGLWGQMTRRFHGLLCGAKNEDDQGRRPTRTEDSWYAMRGG